MSFKYFTDLWSFFCLFMILEVLVLSCDWPLCVCVCFPWPLGVWFNPWPGCEWVLAAGHRSVSEGVPADGWTQRGMDTRLLYWGSSANSLTSTSSSGHLLLIIHTCTHAKHTALLSNTHTHTSADMLLISYICCYTRAAVSFISYAPFTQKLTKAGYVHYRNLYSDMAFHELYIYRY